MCIGLPMQVAGVAPGQAFCTVDGQVRQVSTLLLDRPPLPGEHVLVHGERAIRYLAADEAQLIHDALAAVLAASDGLPFEHLIADLAEREPQLPPHLRPPGS